MDDRFNTWPLRCADCNERIVLELPVDVEEGRTGTATCPHGHLTGFFYNGFTVERRIRPEG